MSDTPPSPVTVACVRVGDKYSADYVAILRDMVGRHLSPARSLRFVCITDRPGDLPEGVEPIDPEPGLPGWWQKIALFKPGKIPGGRIAYFDLDVAISGELDTLVDRPGIIKDWHLPCYNSSVMVWDAGDHAQAWTMFRPELMEQLPGDQDWLTMLGGWGLFPAEWCRSYRAHCQAWPTAGCRVVCFHGQPKPHQVKGGWVPDIWKIGGFRAPPVMRGINVGDAAALESVRSAVARKLPWYTGAPPNNREAVIVGSGPSVRDHLADIRRRVSRGAALISMNGSLRWLVKRRLIPSSHIVLDGRPENVQFVEDVPPQTALLLASQCHPDVFDAVTSHPKVIVWHAALNEEMERVVTDAAGDRAPMVLGGGCTVGMRALYLAFTSGFRRIHVYGMDGSYHGDEHHAFAQPLNDGEARMTIVMAGREYICAPWMLRQANEFYEHWKALMQNGAKVWVHGRGLIPDMAAELRAQWLEIQKAAA